MAGKFICTYRDYGKPGETSSVTFNTVDITAGNIVAQTTAADALRLAMEAIMTEGSIEKRQLVAWVNDTKVLPVSPLSQREIKWVVKYHDASSLNKFRLEIPQADLSKLDPNATDKILMTDPDVLAFIAAFETLHRSPEGNAAVVDEILFVSVGS
jgi:hypothetical protein